MTFDALVHTAALWCIAAGLVAAAAVAVAARDGRLGLRVALDFWLGAGLLTLSQATSWEPLLVTALILGVRQTVGLSLRHPTVRWREVLPWAGGAELPTDTPDRR